MKLNNYIRQEVVEIILYIAIGIIFFVLLPAGSGFFLEGFSPEFKGGAFNLSTYLGAFIVYFFLMIGAVALIIFPISRLILLKPNQHPATQENPKWWTIFTVSLIHSPEENGALYRLFDYFEYKGNSNPMNWSLSILRVSIYSILLFGLLGILQTSIPQYTIFASVPTTPQQITLASDIIFGAGVPAFTENGILMFVFFLMLGINAYICSKFIPKAIKIGSYFAIAFALCFILAFGWQGFHHLVYSSSDIKSFTTYVFGASMLLLTLLLASIIPALVWHFMNNFFIKISTIASTNETIIPIIIFAWIMLLIGTLVFEYYLWQFKKKKRESITIPR